MAPSRFETSIFGPSILIVIPSCRALLWFLAFSYQFLVPNFMNFSRNFSAIYFFSSRTFLYWAPIIRIVKGSRKYEQIIINNVKIEEKRDDIKAKFSNVSEFLFWASFGIKFNVQPSQIEKITGNRHARVKTSIVDEPLTLIGKSWKTHPEIFLKFWFSGSSHRPFYWKTPPLKIMSTYSVFFHFWGHTHRYTGKLIHSNFLTETIYVTFELDEFSSKLVSEISKKFANKG